MTPQRDEFSIGLVQMSCGPDPETNLEKAVTRVRHTVRTSRLHIDTVNSGEDSSG